MSERAPTASQVLMFACPACGRRFAVVRAPGGVARSRCACGAELIEAPLLPGAYELRVRHRRRRRASSRPRRAEASVSSASPLEADLGYGQSHGYGPAHGGPSGPGDAPAAAPSATQPAPSATQPPDEEVPMPRNDGPDTAHKR